MKRNLFSTIMLAASLAFMTTACVKEVPVTGITVSPTSLTLNEGEKGTVTATILPEDASDQTFTWSSDNTNVATVNAKGEVSAIKAGTANIKATSTDGKKTATCVVTVRALVAGITLDQTKITIDETKTATLKATITPDNASNKNIVWSTSDAKVATVANGVVTGVKAGRAVITATTEDGGKTAECAVTVLARVSGVTLDKTEASLNEGQTLTLVPTIAPANASNTNVTWSSSDNEVATVSADGVVTAVNVGTATITVTTEDNAKTATCTITVLAVVTGVELDRTALTVMVGQKGSLTAKVLPAKASNKNVTWATSDAAVATVENGVVTGVKAGTATITVTTVDGGFTKTCTITVSDKPGFGAEDYNNGNWKW